MIEQWDHLIRLLAIGTSLMLLAQLVAGEVRSKIKLPVVAMIVGAIAYLLSSTPDLIPPSPMDTWLGLMSLSVPFWIWLFARNLFERAPPRQMVLAAAAILLLAWFLGNLVETARFAGFLIIHFVSLGLIADLVRVALRDRDDDLVEQRRIIRLWLPLLVAAQAGTVLVAEMIFTPLDPPALMRLFNGVMILMLNLFAGLALLRTDPELLVRTQDEEVTDKELTPPSLSPSETVLHEKLTAAMANGMYREPGLTIAGLADQLGSPEHRLRTLINRRMGHRNFSAFLNRHRISEAREKLSSRESADLPVLTIAMDLGYNSLPTFNRAFRNETGTTPSEFRRLAISDALEAPAEPAGQN